MTVLALLALLFLHAHAYSEPSMCGEHSDGGECVSEQRYVRDMLPKASKFYKAVAEPIPRVHVTELDLPQNEDYKSRRLPYILTGAMEGWGILDTFVLDEHPEDSYLANMFRREVADFYPYNMLVSGTHPYLYRFKAGLKEMMAPSKFLDRHNHESACEEGCRYLHLQLTPTQWAKLEKKGDVLKKRHPHIKGDNWWMKRCMPNEILQDEYHLKTHWQIILTGTKGSGMFNHTDSLRSSSWHGHVQGRKYWHVCGRADYNGRLGPFKCYESIVHPGEVLYYGPDWHHMTRILDTPTTTITGTIVTLANHRKLSDKIMSECSRGALNFDFSGALCDALDKCYTVWHKVLRGKDPPPGQYKKWRDLSTAENIATKDAIDPTHNNYDGRNFISEQ